MSALALAPGSRFNVVEVRATLTLTSMHAHAHEKKFVAAVVAVAAFAGLVAYAERSPRSVPVPEVAEQEAVRAEAPKDVGPAEVLAPEAGETRYRIGEGSKVSFAVNEVLRGSPSTVVATTADVAGDIVLDAQHGKARIGLVAVDARTLKTGDGMRDRTIASAILRSSEPANAFITFKPVSIDGLPASIAPGAPFDLAVTGDLTVAGTVRSVTFKAAAQLSGDTIVAKADTTVLYRDLGISVPSVPFVASVDDDVTITVDVVAVKA